jgi:outer membrane immunogenic protein
LGYAFGRVLVYGTGGLADAKVQAGFNSPATFDNASNFGWTGGGGIEFAFADNWTAKVEYLYAALGTMTCSTPANCGNSVPVTISLSENIVRAGINYKFAPW